MAWTHRAPIDDVPTVAGDLRERDAVVARFEALRPTIVIHAAVALGADSIVAATGNVVDASEAVGAHLVHLSTDAVFSGDGIARDEDAPPDPISTYGHWKAEAERLVPDEASVVRLPLAMSIDPDDGATARIRATSPTHWFDDELRQPAMADELAAATWRIARHHGRAGVWHLPGPERLSRFEIAQRIAAALRLDPTRVVGEPSPAGAARPRDLNLGDHRARAEIDWNPRPIFR